jgi:uncharacterized membrane protein YhaH (DUF805 family)
MKWYIKCIRQYADFKGRARREEYWMFTLFNFLISMVLLIPFFLVVIPLALEGGYSDIIEGDTAILLALAPVILYGLFILLPNLAVCVRRFHDTGKSGWLYFVICVAGQIPYIGFIASIYSLVVCCTDSQYGENKWGPNPKGLGNKKGNTPAEKEEFSEWDTDSEEEAKL